MINFNLNAEITIRTEDFQNEGNNWDKSLPHPAKTTIIYVDEVGVKHCVTLMQLSTLVKELAKHSPMSGKFIDHCLSFSAEKKDA